MKKLRNENNNTVVAIVANFKYLRMYFDKFHKQIRGVGEYKGEILILTSYFTPLFLFRSLRNDKKIKIYRYRNIKFSKNTLKSLNEISIPDKPNRNITKPFQWHKIHLFDKNLKIWKYIFYMDINMNIHYDLNPILNTLPINKLFARADSYPNYDKKLKSQFYENSKLFNQLSKDFNLEVRDYFQTGIMFFDTSIVDKNTKSELISLVEKYPISITNEQGIMNLYFAHINNFYRELPSQLDGFETYFYWMVENKKIIITKQARKQYK